MADPFSDNPFAVGTSANNPDASNPYGSTGAWGTAPGDAADDSNGGAWGATTTTNNDVYTPSTLPPATGYMSGGGGGGGGGGRERAGVREAADRGVEAEKESFSLEQDASP